MFYIPAVRDYGRDLVGSAAEMALLQRKVLHKIVEAVSVDDTWDDNSLQRYLEENLAQHVQEALTGLPAGMLTDVDAIAWLTASENPMKSLVCRLVASAVGVKRIVKRIANLVERQLEKKDTACLVEQYKLYVCATVAGEQTYSNIAGDSPAWSLKAAGLLRSIGEIENGQTSSQATLGIRILCTHPIIYQ